MSKSDSALVRIGITIPEGIRRTLKSDAAFDGISLNDLIKHHIAEGLAKDGWGRKEVMERMGLKDRKVNRSLAEFMTEGGVEEC